MILATATINPSTYFLIAAIIIGVIGLVLLNVKNKGVTQVVNDILFALAVEAEKVYGGKTGVVKKNQVISWFYERYPYFAKLVTPDDLSVAIDSAVELMNTWLKSNPVGAKNVLPNKEDTDGL